MSWNERIKAAREAQKLTREQTVRKMRDYLPAGKTAAARTLVAWEQGDSEPKVTQAIALARALGYHEVSELFSQADGPAAQPAGDGPAGGIPPPAAAIGRIPGAARRAPPAHAAGVFAARFRRHRPVAGRRSGRGDGGGRRRPGQGRVWRAAGGRQYVAALCGRADRLGAQGRAGRERRDRAVRAE